VHAFPDAARGHYDAWGFVTWYNRSIRVSVWWRNWQHGRCAKVRISTTRSGDFTTRRNCRVNRTMSYARVIDGSRLGPGGIRGVAILPANGDGHGHFTFKGSNGTWIERPRSRRTR
jgi:hypothetical protein